MNFMHLFHFKTYGNLKVASIVLFCGFSVFTTSNFGGTQALGLLTSITLLIAMLSNLLLLPSFLLTMEKWITKKDLSDNILDIYDPEVDPSEDDENNML